MTYNILCLPGDGIGKEVCHQATRILEWFGHNRGLQYNIDHDLVGGACYDVHHVAVTDATINKALNAHAVLFGAVGGPDYDNVPRDARPEAGLLRLRKDLDLFANLRPAMTFEPLLDSSTLKREVVEGLDILILRELTAGVYFGQPRGMQNYEGVMRCIDTQSYTEAEISRIAILAFQLARKRHNMVHSAEKANVMETGAFWRNIVTKIHQESFNDVVLHHMYADNCAMQLVRNPKQFDVIVTDNLFGDILSDAAAMCTGSLGMLPSASLGTKQDNGMQHALYEPVHGSAPDIAGQDKANPLAMLLSTAMMFKYSFDRHDDAALLEQAINDVLARNIRTGDIKDTSTVRVVGTQQMGDIILETLDQLL